MSWGPTDKGAMLTGSGKWGVYVFGDELLVQTADEATVSAHLLDLINLEIVDGFIWATCKFNLRTPQGRVERSVDGIPNERAAEMAASIHQSTATTIAKLVSAASSELDAWVERGVRTLSAPGSDQKSAGEVMASLAPPGLPAGVSWDQVFGNRAASHAKTTAKAWPSWVGTPTAAAMEKASALRRDSFKVDLASWVMSFRDSFGPTRWVPKGAFDRFVRERPPPAWLGKNWAGALSGLRTPPKKTGSFFLDVMAKSELDDLGHGLSHDEWKALVEGSSPAESLKLLMADHNELHLVRQREARKPFFDTVEKNPLTDEQVHACICMDDAVMVVAAAGSGKTSTMVAKTGYALHESLATPDQILLLAFNRATAEEVGERIKEQLSGVPDIEKVRSNTFHAFGIQVIGQATGEKPSLAPWVSPDNPGGDIREVDNIITVLSAQDPQFKRDWDFFRTVYGRDVGKWDQPQEPDAYGAGKRGFRTANNDIVKSKEERVIADWLFYSGVNYLYEHKYKFKTATPTHRQYCPDFYYPDIDLYHEHFALNANGQAPPHFKDYVEGVEWKRAKHAEMETALVETTSHNLASGEWMAILESALIERGIEPKFDSTREAPGIPPISQYELARSFRVFQQHVKNNGLTHQDLLASLALQSEDGFAARLRLYLSLYERIAGEWERRLRDGEFIDFEDMLIQAAEHVESGAYPSPYTLILADEFQDSSRARIRLLKALCVNPGIQTHLCVVGDDWQGINRFAGSDISVMTEFEKIFDYATRLTLNTTFRCPQQLCDVASAFIQANPAQITKSVETTNTLTRTPIQAFGFASPESMSAHIEDQLAQMHSYATQGKLAPLKGAHISVMLLGRYNSDRPASLDRWQRSFKDRLRIEFRTAHGSKGLEAEYVFVLNVVRGTKGFPSEIQDDPALQLAMPAPDPYPFAEERRLFYVAMTRARKQVRFYTMLHEPSEFLVELVKAEAIRILAIEGEAMEPCPKCSAGVLKLRTRKAGAIFGCSRFPGCDFERKPNAEESKRAPPATPSHRIKVPVNIGDPCPICKLGKIQQKNGKNGSFLACSRWKEGCKASANLPAAR